MLIVLINIKDLYDVFDMNLEVNKDNLISFSYLIKQITPINEYKCINGYIKKFFTFNFNCRAFVSYDLNITKPIYDSGLIKKCEKTYFESKNEESLIFDNILKTLKKFEDY